MTDHHGTYTTTTHITMSQFTVSLFPETDPNHRLFAITITRGHRQWVVLHQGLSLNADSVWAYETHWFDGLDTALRMAEAAAPHVKVNGLTAAAAQARSQAVQKA